MLHCDHEKQAACQILERVEHRPAQAQDELADFARDIEKNLSEGDYELTPEEEAGVKRGLRGADRGHFATEAEVKATFAKYRRR